MRSFPTLLIASVLFMATINVSTAAPMPKNWHAPKAWLAQAVCVHNHEGAWNAATGNSYEGGGQFLLSTWRSVGGPVVRDSRGYITHWASAFSPREQLYRMWLVWKRDGGSWKEWGTKGRCNLR